MTDIFTIHHDQAERYGSYVRQGTYDPYGDDDQRAELAWYAWQRGTGPVMSPPYVSRDQRVLSVSLGLSQGVLTARLDVVLPQPATRTSCARRPCGSPCRLMACLARFPRARTGRPAARRPSSAKPSGSASPQWASASSWRSAST